MAKWNKESITEILHKYDSITEFKYANRGAHKALKRLDMYEEVKAYYNVVLGKDITELDIEKEAIKYTDIHSFKYGSRVYYEKAIKLGIYKQVTGHITPRRNGFDVDKPAILYYLNVCNQKAYKIGITNRSVDKRFSLDELSKVSIIKTWNFDNGLECLKKEQEILSKYTEYKYIGKNLLKIGNTELFNKDVLSLDKTKQRN